MSNHITEQEAKAASRLIIDISTEDGSTSAKLLAAWAMNVLARRDAERAERDKPIDAEWLESIGFDFNGLRLRRLLSIGHYELSASPQADDLLLMQDDDAIAIPHISTRGQLLDLLAALKGGAS